MLLAGPGVHQPNILVYKGATFVLTRWDGIAVLARKDSPPPLTERESALRGVRMTASFVGAAIVVMLALHWLASHAGLTPHALFIGNVCVIFLAAAGLTAADRPTHPVAGEPTPRWEIALVVALTVVGAVMRTARWDVFPPVDGQLLEEPQVAWNAALSIREGHIDIYFPLVNLVGEIGFRVLGPTMNGLRAPFVVLGILSVPIFHLAARSFLKSRRAALFVTALFTTHSMLAGSSRIALETLHPIFTTVVALAVVFRAGSRPTAGNCAVAGACNGLLFLEYDSYRIVPILSGLFLALRLLTGPADEAAPSPGHRRSARLAFLLVFAVFVGAIELARSLVDLESPLEFLGDAFRRHESYLAAHRAQLTWGDLVSEELGKLGANLRFPFVRGGPPEVLPESMGLFDPYTGILGTVALCFCLLGAWWRPLRLFPVAALALMLVLSSVLVGNIARYRLMPSIPYFLLSIGLLVETIEERLPRARAAFAAALVCLAIGLGLLNAYRFFGVAIWEREVQESFYDLNMILSHEISELQRQDPGARVIVLSDQHHLGVPNDYAFWYDYETVEVFQSPEPARGRSGYLLAHDDFIPSPQDLPGMRDCEEWTTRFDRNRVLLCRLAPGAATSP